ncbi:MAG: PKD domain-containing protein [Flavobacteriales bacterium]|nr:PKD domain-containing protein [Flavobacteriales bacterium]
MTVLVAVFSSSVFSMAGPKYAVNPFSDISFCDAVPTAYVVASTFSIVETNVKGFKKGQNENIVLTLPTGFEFNPGVGTVTFDAGNDITSIAVNSITASQIDIQVVTDKDDFIDAIHFSNFEIRAVSASASGDLLRGATSGPGNFKIDGFADFPGDGNPNAAESLGFLYSGPDMTYTSSTTTQGNTNSVSPNSTDAEMIGVEIETNGLCTPFNLTELNFDTDGGNGSGSDAPSTDILNARVYYTGTSSTFAKTNQFGSDMTTPSGTFSITGAQELTEGTNYFWLVYDLPSGAVVDNEIDAQCTSVVLDGSGGTQTPTVTNPSGARVIAAYFSRQTGNWSDVNSWSVGSCGGAVATGVPGASDDVVICSGNTISLDGAITVNKIIISDGGVLNDGGGANGLTLNGNFQTLGTGYFVFPSNGNLVVNGDAIFQGTGSSTLSGIATFTGELNVGSGVTLTQTANKDVLLKGDLICDGTIALTGTKKLKMDGFTASSISGVGTITSTNAASMFEIKNADRTILAGTDLTIQPYVHLNSNTITVINNGSINMQYNGVNTQGDINGKSSACVWTNAENASLKYEGRTTMFNTAGVLIAAASGNTVNYSSDVAQTMILPQSNIYYNLTTSGAGIKTAAGDIDVDGDVLIDSDFDTGTNNLNIAGNWTNNSSFVIGSGTIEFDGASLIGGTATTTVADVNITGIMTGPVSGTLNVTGNWTSTGTFVHNSSNIVFNGSTAQTISGTNTFHDVTINNSSGVSISSGTGGIEGSLTLTSGTFNTNSVLTLISNASGTGRIAEITGGSITGNVMSQQYVSAADGWRLMSSPVDGTTLADLSSEFWTSGFSGATYPTNSFVSVYTYDETVSGDLNQGYVSASNITDGLDPTKGFFAWVGALPIGSGITETLNVTGTTNTGNQVATVNYTDDPSYSDSHDGWALMGNPFPSDIDWSTVTISGGVTPFAYLYDPSTSSYITLDQSSSNVISQHQAFWVKASGSSGTITFKESDKATGGTFYRYDNSNSLRIAASGLGYNTSTDVRVDASATSDYEPQLDAFFWKGLDYSAPSLMTIATNGFELNINTVGDTTTAISIPLKFTVGSGKSGTYTIEIEDPAALANRSCLFLEDLHEGVTIDLRQTPSYSFYISDTVASARFVLHIGGKVQETQENVTCYGGADGSVQVTGAGTGPWDYSIINQIIGDTIETIAVTTSMDYSLLEAGSYEVLVTNSDGSCGTSTNYITILEPTQVVGSSTLNNVSCFGENTGSISITATGGASPYGYEWIDGSNGLEMTNLTAGTYSVIITDNSECEIQLVDIFITEPQALGINTVLGNITCHQSNDGFLSLELNGGQSPYSYLWSNQSNTSIISDLESGIYAVTVTDANNCVIETTMELTKPVQVVAGFSLSADTVALVNGEVFVLFTNTSTASTSVNWNFGNGFSSTENDPSTTYTSAGTYYIELIASNDNGCSESMIQTVVVNEKEGTGIESIQTQQLSVINTNQGLLVTNNFNYQVSDVELTVYNSLGQTIYSSSHSFAGNAQVVIPTEEEAAGVYILKMQLDDKVESYKFAK